MKIPLSGYAIPKGGLVSAESMEKSGKLTIKDGAKLNFSKGDIKLTDEDGNFWVIKRDIFKSTYQRASDNSYNKKPIPVKFRKCLEEINIKNFNRNRLLII